MECVQEIHFLNETWFSMHSIRNNNSSDLSFTLNYENFTFIAVFCRLVVVVCLKLVACRQWSFRGAPLPALSVVRAHVSYVLFSQPFKINISPLFYWFPFVRLGDGCWWVCLCVASGLCMRVLCLMNYSAWLIGCWILLHMKGALAWHVPPLPLTLCTLWNLLPPPSLQLSFRLALLILSCADLLMQYKFDVCRLKTRYTLTVSETFPERRSPQKKDCWHQLLSAVLLVLSFSLAKKWIRGVHLTQKRNKNTKIVK